MSSGENSHPKEDSPVVQLPEITVPPPDGPLSPIPDAATRRDPAFTHGDAPNQVFHFQRWGLSYGTDDKGHAAAILLSIAILLLMLLVIGIGSLLTERAWLEETLKVLGNAFLIVAGIAVGKSVSKD